MSTQDDPPAGEQGDAFIDALARGAFARAGPLAEAVDERAEAGLPEGFDIAEIMAWQAGELSDEAAEALERRLSEDDEARAIATELSAPVPPFLAAWARRQLPGQRSRWARRAAPVLIALAAAALFFVLRPVEPGPGVAPDYGIVAVRGTHQVVRGDGPAPETRAIDAEGVLTVALAPATALDSAPPSARAFVVRDGALVAAPADALTAGEGGALRFKASARELFGEVYGPRAVLFAVGADGERLDRLAGQPEAEARSLATGVRWLRVEVIYEAAP